MRVQEVTIPFLLRCLLAHVALLGYLWLASWYADNLKVLLAPWLQTVIGAAYLASLLASFYRVDLIAVSSPARGPHPPPSVVAGWIFFARVVQYYGVVLGLPATLLLCRERLPTFLSAYGAFVFFAVLINHADYALPSYSRYRRLAAAGKWGLTVARDVSDKGSRSHRS